jgi:hypothetical protein
MSGDIGNSQAARDAERAAGDLAKALRAGATLGELAELTTTKGNADERLAALRRRVGATESNSRQTSADMLERRQRRRDALRAELDKGKSPDLTGGGRPGD